MGREKYAVRKEQLIIWRVVHHLAFTDDVPAAEGAEWKVQMAILYTRIQPNASKLIGQHFRGQMDNDLSAKDLRTYSITLKNKP